MSIVAIIGRPNVGKSSIFNRLVGERRSIEANEPGTTRDRVFGVCAYRNKELTVIDSAGIDFSGINLDNAEIKKYMDEQISMALKQANVILFVTDAKYGITVEDEKIIDLIRKQNKPVVFCANKADHINDERNVAEWNSTGFDGVYPVSAIHNGGIEQLKSVIFDKVKPEKIKPKNSSIKVALIGRPNVGKSTLLNFVAGHNRSIVAPVAGTTRDSVNEKVEFKGTAFEFVDTAGIRKRGKIVPGIEKFSVLRAVKAVEESDIAILLLDATEGVKAGDAHIAGLAIELGKGLVIAVNKWDVNKIKSKVKSQTSKAVDDSVIDEDDVEQRTFIAELHDSFAFIPWAPVIFISAIDGKNCHKLLDRVRVIASNRKLRLEQEVLDQIPKIAKEKQPRLSLIYSFNQLDTDMPNFEIVVNKPDSWHFSDMRMMENVIRAHEPFEGTPIKITLTPYAKSQPR
jgi:GTP-binding protein